MGAAASKSSNVLKHCTLWKADRSPACRAVMMTIDALNLDINEVDVNMDRGEHRCPEMVLMNPLQTLPVLKDRELILCDSHAIATYMATRYSTSMSCTLLPSDPAGRALVDQQLHFNSGVLYPRFKEAAYPILYRDCRSVAQQTLCDIECAYCDIEHMLAGRPFHGGSWCSVGDIVLAATVSTLNVLVPVDAARFPKTSTWLFRMSENLWYITANQKGLCEFARRIGELAYLQMF